MEKLGKGSVILVHGLWMNAPSLLPLAKRLEGQGYRVQRHGYASCRKSLDENALDLAEIIRRTRAVGQVHLLGHSLGGLVALSAILAAGPPHGVAAMRLVMLGSPFAGSHCVNTLSHSSLLAPVFGRTLPEWLARPRPRLPEWLEVGVIAGRHCLGLGHVFVPSLREPNDGVVSVTETVVPGCRDTLCLDVSHMGMLLSGPCVRQAEYFFETGRFLHAHADA